MLDKNPQTVKIKDLKTAINKKHRPPQPVLKVYLLYILTALA